MSYNMVGDPPYSLDEQSPKDPSLAEEYWCEMNYFLAHTGYGVHPPCRCSNGLGHNDPDRRRFHTQRLVYNHSPK